MKRLMILLIVMLSHVTLFAQYSENVTVVSKTIYGDYQSVFVDGNYTYFGREEVLGILDVSDPTTPTLVSEYVLAIDENTSFSINDIYVSGNYAYLATRDSLRIIDVSDPTAPTQVGSYRSPYSTSVSVSGNYAYIVYGSTVRVIDVSDPSSPTQVASFPQPGWKAYDDANSDPEKIHIENNYAYVAYSYYEDYWQGNDINGGIAIFDITNPSAPTKVGSYEIVQDNFYAYGIDVWGNYAYLLTYNYGLRVIDISNPSNPTQVNSISGGVNLDISNSYIYLTTSGPYQLKILSLSYPSSPSEVGTLDIDGWSYGIHVSGDYAYIAFSDAGVLAVDVSTPSSPAEVGFFDTHDSPTNIHVANNYAYIQINNYYSPDGVQVMDISDPSLPAEVSFMEGLSIGQVYGNYAISGNLHITDISDPTSPEEVSSFQQENTTFGSFHISNNYIYTRYRKDNPTSYGMEIIDISDPSAPTPVGELELDQFNIYGKTPIYVHNNHVYLFNEYWDGVSSVYTMRIIDVSDRRSPTQAGLFTFPESVDIKKIIVVGNYAYLFESQASSYGRDALHIVDVSDPAAPVLSSSFKDFGLTGSWSFNIDDVTVYNDYAYIATGWDSLGLAVVDISDPAAPVLAGFFDLYSSNQLKKIHISSNYIYSTSNIAFSVLQNDLTGAFSTDFMADVTSGNVPLTVQFTDLSEGQPISWEWDFDNDGTIDSQEKTPLHTYDVPGEYTVSLTVSDGTNTLTETKVNYITTESFLEAHFSADTIKGTKPLTVQFSDSSIALQTTITSWAWDLDGDGTNDSEEQNPVWTYDEAGKYTVVLAVSDGVMSDTLTKEDYIIVTLFDEYKLSASDAEEYDNFGWTVSMSGDYALLGARYDDDHGSNSGSAYIFKREGDGWLEQPKLTASDAAASNQFGQSVSISGDYALVGAPGNRNGGVTTGSAYIFKRDGETWAQQTKLFASDGLSGDQFGFSVSISGDYALVGAYADDDSGNASGSAYIFKRDGTIWSEQAKLTASDGAENDNFGYSVSISGDYSIVGAYRNDDSGESSGSAYVFKREGETWTEAAKLIPNDPAEGDQFGYSVSIKGDDAVVGTPQSDDSGNSSGSAYIFALEGENWIQQAKLTANDAAASDQFGRSVAVKRDYAVAGAYYDDDDGSNSGSAYVFRRDGTNWVEEAKITTSDGAQGDYFGSSVSISGIYILIGAFQDDEAGYDSNSGSAYIYRFVSSALFADFTADVTAGFAPLTVQFTDLSEGSPASWSWDFESDGTIDSEDQNPSWTYFEPGLYNVTLTISDGVNSLSETKENYIRVLTSENPEPEISSIMDIQEDQGGKVFVSWIASSLDIEGEIVQYGVWSRNDTSDWFSLGIVPTIPGSGSYTFLATTLGDSSAEGIYWSYFQITAHTQDPFEYYLSEIDSGYSVDNLAPAVPTSLLASVTAENMVELSWDPPVDEDFNYFKIYRSLEPDFNPTGLESFAESIDTTFIDSDVEIGETYYYILSAVDFNGNESDFSDEVSAEVLSLDEFAGTPEVFALRQNYPNPFNPVTTLRYDLQEQAFVTLVIYDLLGREVKTLVNRIEEPGYKAVIWDATNDNNQPVGAGLYLCQIQTKTFVKTRKMILLK